MNKIYVTESETEHTVSALGKTFHKTDIAPITEAQYKALTFDQAGKKRKLDTDAGTSKDSPVTKPKNSLKPTTKKSTTEKKLYRTGEWYLGTDEEPYDNNGKCLTEGVYSLTIKATPENGRKSMRQQE